MSVLPQRHFTVAEYLDWAIDHPGRYELHNGKIHAISPGGAGYAAAKFSVQTALAADIRAHGLPCHLLPSGLTVRVEAATAFEPDALVYCGEELESSGLEVPNPVIVVEVLAAHAPHRHLDEIYGVL